MDRPRAKFLLLVLAAMLCPVVAGCGGSDRPTKKESAPRSDSTAAKRAATAAPPETAEAPEPAGPEARIALEIAALESGNLEQKKAALAHLSAAENRALATAALPAIRQCLTDDRAPIRGLAGIAILQIKGKEGAYLVRPLLGDSALEVRASVYNELGKLGKEFDDELMRGLDDASPEIQEIALDFLSRQNNKRAAPRAIGLYDRTESEALRAQILTYLVRIDSKEGVGTVLKSLNDLETPAALALAVRYIGKCGDEPQARKAVRFLDDVEVPVRLEAVDVVQRRKIRTLDAIAALIHLLGDDAQRVRAAAHQALKELTGQDFGFNPAEFDAEEVKPALEAWEKWLQENGAKLPKD